MRRNLDHAHRERTAYVYVRQSTAAQILEHTESTKRQYGLVERAQALGWSRGAIEVIDEDQGKSGASARGRDGFARLVDAVVKGEASAILAVEVSRLSRSSEDWRRLLGLCGVAGVVVIPSADGVRVDRRRLRARSRRSSGARDPRLVREVSRRAERVGAAALGERARAPDPNALDLRRRSHGGHVETGTRIAPVLDAT